MFEKVNPAHPDKVADRIAGALVDLAYANCLNPRVAIEVLIGHGQCYITGESSYPFKEEEVKRILDRLTPGLNNFVLNITHQDKQLASNQLNKIRCGDNGIFKGMPVTTEQYRLSEIAKNIYRKYPTDGKYIINDDALIICQSNARNEDLLKEYPAATINPLGEWYGGINVDAGATNRKLGSDMADSVTGGGLHGKDLSKADVSINIYAWLQAQASQTPQYYCCAIGDEVVNGIEYNEIVEVAREYIRRVGGFEKFAEWGLV